MPVRLSYVGKKKKNLCHLSRDTRTEPLLCVLHDQLSIYFQTEIFKDIFPRLGRRYKGEREEGGGTKERHTSFDRQKMKMEDSE